MFLTLVNYLNLYNRSEMQVGDKDNSEICFQGIMCKKKRSF